MIPDELMSTGDTEMAVTGTSMLPVSLEYTSDATNHEISMDLVFLLHYNNCAGGRHGANAKRQKPCSWITNVFPVSDHFAQRRAHFEKCPGADCAYPYCKQSQALYDHWMTCTEEDYCFICSPAVELLMNLFISFLIESQSTSIKYVATIQISSLKTLKKFLDHPEDRLFENP